MLTCLLTTKMSCRTGCARPAFEARRLHRRTLKIQQLSKCSSMRAVWLPKHGSLGCALAVFSACARQCCVWLLRRCYSEQKSIFAVQLQLFWKNQSIMTSVARQRFNLPKDYYVSVHPLVTVSVVSVMWILFPTFAYFPNALDFAINETIGDFIENNRYNLLKIFNIQLWVNVLRF